MSISSEAIFGAIALLLALPSAAMIIMRCQARPRRNHILPLVQAPLGVGIGATAYLGTQLAEFMANLY